MISIIIVGVGEDNFENMVELDADKQAIISSWGEATARDIV